MPLPWDKEPNKDIEFTDPEKVISIDDWQDRLSKLNNTSKPISPEDLQQMNI